MTTMRARVQPPCPVLALRDRIAGHGTPDEVPATFAAWLAENHSSDEWRYARRLTWRESRVERGDTVDDAPLSLGDDRSLLRPPSSAR